jgi:hypothetical protein
LKFTTWYKEVIVDPATPIIRPLALKFKSYIEFIKTPNKTGILKDKKLN